MSSKTIDNNGKTIPSTDQRPTAHNSLRSTQMQSSPAGPSVGRSVYCWMCHSVGHSVVHFCRPVDIPYGNLLGRLIRCLLYRLPTGPRSVVELGERCSRCVERFPKGVLW